MPESIEEPRTSPSTHRGWVLAPLPAIAVGVAIAAAHGVRWTAYLPNLVAALLGAGIVLGVRGRAAGRIAAWTPIVAALAILGTLLGPGVDGVHRWLAIGGVRLDASMVATPWILFGLAVGGQRSRVLGVAAVLVAAVTHVVQPDAGQATALAVGVLPLALDRRRTPTSIGIPLALATIGLACAAWFVPDPLAPVDHVERILILGASHGALGIAAMVVAGVALLVPFATPLVERVRDPVALALVGVLLAMFVVTFVGHFPVPVFGAGAGPVLGWYGALAVHGLATRRPEPASRGHTHGT